MMLSEETLREFLSEKYPAYDFEIRNGEYVLVSPHDFISSTTCTNMCYLLASWVRPRKLGYVSESNGGYRYEDGDLMAPDVAFISVERMPTMPLVYALAVPELVVEIRSSSDRERAVRAKLALLLEKGSTVAIYVDPRRQRFEIYRMDREPEIFTGDDMVTIEDVLPGFSFPLAELWP